MRWTLGCLVLAACGRFGFSVNDSEGGGTRDAPVDGDGAIMSLDGIFDAPAPARPLVWLPFDEPAGSGIVNDTGTLGATTTATFAAQGVAGRVNSAIALDGTTHAVVIADRPELAGFTQFTLEGWIYLLARNAQNYSTVVKKEGGYILRTCDVGSCGVNKVGFIMWDSAGSHSVGADIVLPLSTWVHLAGTFDGTAQPRVLRLYIDGTLANTTTYSGGDGTVADTNQPFVVGRHQMSGENLAGRIDELKLWIALHDDAGVCASALRTWTGADCI
jgi:hypothetical protein